jgi:basic amino acid/polyamine antiporter, APA family
MIAKNKKKKLNRKLGGLSVFSISSGAMISSGLFILPGLIFAKSGPAVIIAYILAGLFILPLILSKIELITAMPKAGGSYFFIERSMGSVAGTIGGFVGWLSLSLKSAFALVGIGAFATIINPSFTEWQIKLIAGGFCVLFTILNLISVGVTAKIQNVIVVGLVILLIIYIVRGSVEVDVNNYKPFMLKGVTPRTVFAVSGAVFISFAGVTKIASVAEEVRNPIKNIPMGMISAFVVVLFLYTFSIAVTVGVLDTCELGFNIGNSSCEVSDSLITEGEYAYTLTPISNTALRILGNPGLIVMAIAAIFAFVSTANAGILGASRFLLAMGRDQILPKYFSKLTKKGKLPYFSIILTGGFMLLIILGLNIDTLVKVASAMTILLFILELISSVIMRESKILNYKPSFKTPFYPWLQILGIIIYSYLLYEMGWLALLITGGFIILSIIWHKIYFKNKNIRNSALIYMIKRLLPDESSGKTLEDELREILMERDDINEDRFDKLVRDSQVIDLNREVARDEFFQIVSEKCSKLDIDKEKLVRAFIEREEESTTVLRPGLAVPHITVEGKNRFELLIARCMPGVNYDENTEPVYANFILVCSKDERHFHLKALSAIAQITQNENFDKDWLRAKNPQELKDIILLAERNRLQK